MLALRLLRRRRKEKPVNLKFLAWIVVVIQSFLIQE